MASSIAAPGGGAQFGPACLIGLSLLAAYAARPAPKTSGIVELTPQERARYDAALNRVIEDVEIKYGLRPPRPKDAGESVKSGSP